MERVRGRPTAREGQKSKSKYGGRIFKACYEIFPSSKNQKLALVGFEAAGNMMALHIENITLAMAQRTERTGTKSLLVEQDECHCSGEQRGEFEPMKSEHGDFLEEHLEVEFDIIQ